MHVRERVCVCVREREKSVCVSVCELQLQGRQKSSDSLYRGSAQLAKTRPA